LKCKRTVRTRRNGSRTVSCHRIATSIAQWFAIVLRRQFLSIGASARCSPHGVEGSIRSIVLIHTLALPLPSGYPARLGRICVNASVDVAATCAGAMRAWRRSATPTTARKLLAAAGAAPMAPRGLILLRCLVLPEMFHHFGCPAFGPRPHRRR
jgi:hypothetical protein